MKGLEDRLRVSDDPKCEKKLRIDIEKLKQEINQRKFELNVLEKQSSDEEISSIELQHTEQNVTGPSELDGQLIQAHAEKPFLSLTDLTRFCAYTFPLLQWMYEPVPAEHVGLYFSKIQEFFIFEGRHIPCRNTNLFLNIENFFRYAYKLPFFDFQFNLNQIDHYAASGLSNSYRGFMIICVDLGYQPTWNIIENSIEHLNIHGALSLLRLGFSQVLKNTHSTSPN